MYSSVFSLAAVANKPKQVVTGSATLQISVYDLLAGLSAAAADDQYEYHLLRFTDAGTGGSAITEDVLGSTGPGSGATCKGGTYGADPTAESSRALQHLIFNHRAGCRIPIDPRYPIRSKPAANNGIGLQCIASGGGGTVKSQVKFYCG